MSRHLVVGVMGPGSGANKRDIEMAEELGRRIAKEGWTLLTGGVNEGVMDAASKGAREAGGLTIGILPYGDGKRTSKYVDVEILTNMGSGRNYINVLSCRVLVACGMGAGTASEVVLAIKAGTPVVLLQVGNTVNYTSFAAFCKDLLKQQKAASAYLQVTTTVEEAIEATHRVI